MNGSCLTEKFGPSDPRAGGGGKSRFFSRIALPRETTTSRARRICPALRPPPARRMGKNDFLSPKGIANASKAKGLQKLRFYCQVCAKQCRDQNGFKCHITSEAHLRQMELFGQNQSRFIDGYSEEFLKEFLQLMGVRQILSATAQEEMMWTTDRQGFVHWAAKLQAQEMAVSNFLHSKKYHYKFQHLLYNLIQD